MNGLHVDSIIKSYGNNQLLTDIFISCNPGEIVGLLGRNGSGKSTLLKIIFGSLNADTKFVKVGDKIINGVNDSRNLINYLPQDGFLPNHIKIKTIINLFCDKYSGEIIAENPLIRPLVNKKCNKLSGGEKRLLEILLITYSKANYVLIDEPFNGIAPVYKDEIKRHIQEQSKFKGFIITDHDYRNILDVASRVLILHDGAIQEIKNREELIYWGYLPQAT